MRITTIFAIDFDKNAEETYLYHGALKIALGQEYKSTCSDFGRTKELQT
jgi:hypothetical protein